MNGERVYHPADVTVIKDATGQVVGYRVEEDRPDLNWPDRERRIERSRGLTLDTSYAITPVDEPSTEPATPPTPTAESLPRDEPARHPCGCEVQAHVVWEAAGTGTYCPTCGASLARPSPKPPPDTSWLEPSGVPEAHLKQVGRWTYYVTVQHGMTQWGPNGGGWFVLGRRWAGWKARRMLAKYVRQMHRDQAVRVVTLQEVDGA